MLKEKQIIFTPNPEILLLSKNNPSLQNALNCATLLLPDGHGLQFVSTLVKIKSKFLRFILYPPALFIFLFWKKPFRSEIPELIHGSDFMYDIAKWAESNDKSVFFLGGKDESAKYTADFFRNEFPSLKIAGVSNADPVPSTASIVNYAKPDILFVAYGAPKQEIWVSNNLNKLSKIQIIMVVGGSFDFYSGKIKRAPHVFRKLGLEWLFRLYKQPRIRIKRIWNALVRFPINYLFFC